VAASDSGIFWLCPKGVGNKRWDLFEDDPPAVPAYRSYTKVHAYAAESDWGKTDLFVRAGTVGFKSEITEVTAKVYVKLLEEKLIPVYRQLMMECRPVPLRSHPWLYIPTR
jgi:hypothetical protein